VLVVASTELARFTLQGLYIDKISRVLAIIEVLAEVIILDLFNQNDLN
jgi:hypothetical protein